MLIAVKCSHCQSEEVIRHGKSSNGKQRFRCLNLDCPYQTFSLDCAYPGRKREVKRQIVDMTLNGSGVRDVARVLHVSTATVLQELKKTRARIGESEVIAAVGTRSGGSEYLAG
jgi:transposase-like protein